MAAAKPVILCGLTKRIAEVVITNLKPEIEGNSLQNTQSPQDHLADIQVVIHLCLSLKAANEQIPLILDGKEAPSSSALGSKDYSRPPRAVILGGGYTDADTSIMMTACEESRVKVPWLRPDKAKPTPPLGPEYGIAMARRVKETMEGLHRQGEIKENTVVWY